MKTKNNNFIRHFLLPMLFVFAIAASSCGGGGTSGDSGGGGGTEPTAATAVIDSAGGTLTGPDGVQVVVPAGALNQPTEIGIARKSEGAPAALDAYPAAGYIYELTPHDLPFNLPVTIRMPVPSGVSGTVFMASPGQDWNVKNATVVNGVAEWESNSFSWMYWSGYSLAANYCPVPTSMLNDPYWCRLPSIGVSISATPPQALTQTPFSPYVYYGRVDQAATLHFQSQLYVPGNCANVTVELYRNLVTISPNGAGHWGPKQTIATQSPALTADGSYLRGTANFDMYFSHLDNGRYQYSLGLQTDCPGVLRANNGDVVGWDYGHYHATGTAERMMLVGNIATPTVFYTVGGSVTGLTGTGLVLQNNGGDNRAVTANGAFTFATSVGAGSPYNVTVFTQPTGQTCTVINGSGTANADVTNVAVNCVLALAISPTNASATSTSCFGGINSTVTFTASNGTQPYSWSAILTAWGTSIAGLTVINATQAQWSDTSEYFCDYSGTVTITVTDSTGASASATIQVN